VNAIPKPVGADDPKTRDEFLDRFPGFAQDDDFDPPSPPPTELSRLQIAGQFLLILAIGIAVVWFVIPALITAGNWLLRRTW